MKVVGERRAMSWEVESRFSRVGGIELKMVRYMRSSRREGGVGVSSPIHK